MSREKWRWGETTVVVLMVIYIVWFSFLSIRQHEAFMTGGFDLGNMDQTLWNTSRGRFLRMTTVAGMSSRLGGHVEPILLLLVPLYWIAPDPRVLLVVQTVVLALGAWAAYQLTCWKLQYSTAGIAMAAIYLLSPVVQGANLFEFHPITLAAALFFFAIYYMLRDEFGRFALFAGLAAFSKEDMPAVVMLMGLYVWIVRRDRRGGWLVAAAAAWFLTANLLIVPAFSPIGKNIHYARYAEVGEGLGEMARTTLTDPTLVWRVATEPEKLGYLLTLLFPVGYLSLLSPAILLLSTPSLAVNLLSSYPLMYVADIQHYSAPVWPFVQASAILGIDVVARGLQRISGVRRGFLVGVLVGYVICFSAFNHILRGRTPLSPAFVMPQVTAHDQLADRFLDQIPPEAVVSAQNPFVAHLSHRPNVYTFPRLDNDTEWLLLDLSVEDVGEVYPFESWSAYQGAVAEVMERGAFGWVDAADGYLLLRRSAPVRPLPESFHTYTWFDAVPAGAEVAVQFGEAVSLVGLEIEPSGAHATILRSWWKRGDKTQLGWKLAVAPADPGCSNESGEEWLVLSASRWYSPANWRPEAIVRDWASLSIPPERLANCMGLRLGSIDEDGRVVAMPIEIEMAGKWEMAVEDNTLSIRLTDGN